MADIIKIDTGALEGYASQLSYTIKSLHDIQSDITSLKAYEGINNPENLAKANHKMDTEQLHNCYNYMKDVAKKFEEVENIIVGEDPLKIWSPCAAITGGLSNVAGGIGGVAIDAVGYFVKGKKSGISLRSALKNPSIIKEFTVAKWGNHVLSALFSVEDNMEEYNYEYTNPDLWGEVVTEVALDIACLTAAGVAVGLGCLLFAHISVPFILASIAGAAIVRAVTWISNDIFHYDIKEHAADGVRHLINNIGDAALSCAEKAGAKLGSIIAKWA